MSARAKGLALALAALAVSGAAGGADAHGWKLERKSDDPRDGYALYARPRAGSSYSEFRLEVPVDATADEVMAALEQNVLDPDAYPDGMQRTVLRREPGLVISHDYIAVPFLADRDAVMRIEIGPDPQTGEPGVRWRAIDGEGPAPREGVVRMPSSTGSWTLAPRAGGTTAVYRSHVELGGSVPAALVRSMLPAEIVRQAEILRRTLRERTLGPRRDPLIRDPLAER